MADWAAIFESISAVGTAGALLVALSTFRDQQHDQRREQASRVIVGGGSAETWWVKNYGEMPVFDVRFRNSDGSQTDPILRLDPGDHEERTVKTKLLNVSATYRDAFGRWWERSSDGRIKDLGT